MIEKSGNIIVTERPAFPWNIKHTNTRDNRKIWEIDRPIPINYEVPMDWHHIIPWNVLRNGWSALATSRRWEVLRQWTSLWGLDDNVTTIVNNMQNGVLGPPINAIMWDKLCWAEWNIVEGPTNGNRMQGDDPGGEGLDTFEGYKIPNNLRDRSIILKSIYTQMKDWRSTTDNITKTDAKPLLKDFEKLKPYTRSPISMFSPKIWELVTPGRIDRFGQADVHPKWRKKIR
jgi:hypothetical protein